MIQETLKLGASARRSRIDPRFYPSSLIPNAPSRSLPCSLRTAPNGLPGIDCGASVIAHELAEAASDPKLTGWFDGDGNENADKCAWTFGYLYNTTSSSGNAVNYNLVGKDGMKFIIQQNWDVPSQSCLVETNARRGWW